MTYHVVEIAGDPQTLCGHPLGGLDLTGGEGGGGPFLEHPPPIPMRAKSGSTRPSGYCREECGNSDDRTTAETTHRHERPEEEHRHECCRGRCRQTSESGGEEDEHRHHPHRQWIVADRGDSEGRRARDYQPDPGPAPGQGRPGAGQQQRQDDAPVRVSQDRGHDLTGEGKPGRRVGEQVQQLGAADPQRCREFVVLVLRRDHDLILGHRNQRRVLRMM